MARAQYPAALATEQSLAGKHAPVVVRLHNATGRVVRDDGTQADSCLVFAIVERIREHGVTCSQSACSRRRKKGGRVFDAVTHHKRDLRDLPRHDAGDLSILHRSYGRTAVEAVLAQHRLTAEWRRGRVAAAACMGGVWITNRRR